MNVDDVFREDTVSSFNSNYLLEMYVDNADGFDGEGDLFTKFGVEIRDQVTFTLSKRRWEQTVMRYDNEITGTRPFEGDLVFTPFSKKIFQIMHIEHEQPFYQLNNLPVFKLQCELFEYNDEDFDVNNDAITQLEQDASFRYYLSLTQGITAGTKVELD